MTVAVAEALHPDKLRNQTICHSVVSIDKDKYAGEGVNFSGGKCQGETDASLCVCVCGGGGGRPYQVH